MNPTVLIVDDHEGFRTFARAILQSGGFDVVGEAADGASGIDRSRELRPDVVLLDIQLPDTDGFAVAERLLGDPEPPAVVLVSSRDASDYGPRISRSGARGFVAKVDLSGHTLRELIGRASCRERV